MFWSGKECREFLLTFHLLFRPCVSLGAPKLRMASGFHWFALKLLSFFRPKPQPLNTQATCGFQWQMTLITKPSLCSQLKQDNLVYLVSKAEYKVQSSLNLSAHPLPHPKKDVEQQKHTYFQLSQTSPHCKMGKMITCNVICNTPHMGWTP